MVVLILPKNALSTSSEAQSLEEDVNVVELQGTLSIPDHLRGGGERGAASLATRSAAQPTSKEEEDVFLGTVATQGGKKATLSIGTLVVDGEVTACKKPTLILRAVHAGDRWCGSSHDNDKSTEGASVASSNPSRKRCRDLDQGSEGHHDDDAPADVVGDTPEAMLFQDWIAAHESAATREVQRRVQEKATAAFEVVGYAASRYIFKGKPSRIFQ